MKVFSRVCLLMIGIGVATTPAFAGDDVNEKAIKARRAIMTLQSWYAGPLFQMAKGELEYNAEMASTYAANLKMMATADDGGMWPEGSDNTHYKGKTRALPEGWSDYDPKHHEALVKATETMAAEAGNGLDALRASIKALGDSCSGCHDAYRAEDF